ncbi:MAG: hypothetical protein LBJ44_03400 [Propionibacteriaceae bacterium]|jgi:hypothetical protein|nr:hypothetical protein [Propionibacteriaceae bacterium]
MPDRWVRALGDAAELHHGLTPAFSVGAAPARALIATLPSATGQARSGWLTWTPTGVELAARRTAGAVFITGSHRLSAVKRLLVNVEGLTVYGPEGGDPGPALVEFSLPGARLWLGLTEEAWRGHSGEGALLASLAEPTVAEDADLVSSLLASPVVSPAKLVRHVEKDPHLLPVLWPLLTEPVRAAAQVATKPPTWVNRVLDLALRHAPYLAEAAHRGLIPADAARWDGLAALAASPAKSAGVAKARRLAVALGLHQTGARPVEN